MPATATQAPRTLIPLVEAELARLVGSGEDLLEMACLDALFPTGKLLRPTLCIESARAVGGRAEPVLSFAAAIECLHVASLVHDDIVDQDPMRRGRASTAERFGLAEALLAGDGLFTAGWVAMLRTGPAGPVLEASRAVAEAMHAMCRASMLETTIREDLSCGRSAVLEVIRGKTAALTGAACQAGAILAAATPEQAEALRQYGELLGTAFQIRDDLLPYTAQDRITGKRATSDVANRQPTLPVLLAYESAGEPDRRLLTRVFHGDADPATAHRDLLDVLTRTGAIAEATRQAHRCVARAREALDGLPSTERLARLADSAVDRHR
ncbi:MULTISPECIES: polyprenyl synthetase family protein [Streptomyces]|uniref:Polyprenyl synthetase family protein n=1 Tax=Streptomyces tricolor TaxID=68277 RepID=A0ABS9JHN5_9ACTN|nr:MULTISPECIES: polyprenyl synthetase family protein [Streptomyces]MCG0065076.1 polyprenyl synthetase family protein [Streptomyces tricolor]OYP13299.1 polyprenyl synthetase family protein [Streptomyces sp. FBKL.4005]